jgi:catechol 2,3-dioxygenase-like lactoylglutathione lyase family enzyme
MLSYITLGANDLQASEHFYSALLEPLGYRKRVDTEGLTFSLPEPPASGAGGPCVVYVKRPFDGQPATAGNGSMHAFYTRSQDAVRQVHGAALAAGGRDEGAPGFRAAYSPDFFVAYVRDPVGNKIAIFCRQAAAV